MEQLVKLDINSWKGVTVAAVGYVLVCRILRYRARNKTHAKYSYNTLESLRSMTNEEAFEIQQGLYATEFPFTTEKALQFALFR